MTSSFRHWFFSPGARKAAALSGHLLRALEDLPDVLSDEADQDLVVALASELVLHGSSILPNWVSADSKYLVLMDVPEPAALRLPGPLGIRKPDQRMHITRDPKAVRRAIIALSRREPWQTLLDAYVLGDRLVTVCGDLSVREFPRKKLPAVRRLSRSAFRDFELDPSGSFLHWPEIDVHLGPSQMLQAVDPMYLAEVEIKRYGMEKISTALLRMREERGLTQSGIEGFSDRQVRRLENEESRFTLDAAQKYALAFGLTMTEFLDELSRRISELRDTPRIESQGLEPGVDSGAVYVG